MPVPVGSLVSRIGPEVLSSTDHVVEETPHGGWKQDEGDLGALADHAQDPVAVFFADVGDVGRAGLEDHNRDCPSLVDSRVGWFKPRLRVC